MKDLTRQLIQLGLSAFESQVYLGLLRRQLTTAGVLAKHLGMKRSTVYTIVDALIEKGLVSLTQIEGVKQYQATDPTCLSDLLEAKQQELNQQKALLENISNDLKVIHEKKVTTPRVTIFEGEQGVNNLLKKTLDEKPSEILVIGQHNPKKDHIPEYTQRRIQEKIPTRVIASHSNWLQSEINSDKEFYRTTYPIRDFKLPASVHIYDHSVLLFTSQKNDPVGVYIENDDISATFKMVFKMLEKNLKNHS